MSREEAASIYLDVLLGFRGEYGKFQEAAARLADNDKELLLDAVSARPANRKQQESFFDV